jgi:shikimate dehydrogenase
VSDLPEEVRRRAAVLGSPIAHSLSPVLHTAAYQALGLTGWQYDRIECDEEALPALLARLGPTWAGLSLTMPLKRVALTVADEVSPVAAAVGAANTLLLGERRRAENTDVAGIVRAVREAGVRQVRHAVLLGAGGTAQAALAALRELGDAAPTVLVRDPGRAGELLATARRLDVRPDLRGGLPRTPVPPCDLLVSTLPAGAADPVAQELIRRDWPGHPAVLDVVYSPWPTQLAAGAMAAGCPVISGLAMLLHQAAAQVELMTGLSAPVERMRAALAEAAGQPVGVAAPEAAGR